MSKDNTNGGGGKTADEQEEEEFTMIEVDGEGKPVEGQVEQSEQEEDQDDDQDETDLGEDQDDEDDERIGRAEGDQDEHAGDETQEEKRARRRRENKAKRVRNRVASEAKDRLIENQGRMLLNLTEQVARLEGRSVQYDVNLLQSQLSQIESQQHDAKAVLAKLVKAGDGEGVAEVTELQMNLRDQHRHITEQLRRAKGQGKGRPQQGTEATEGDNGTRQPQQRRGPSAPDPEVVRLGQAWISKNNWANPRTGDPEEIQIIRAIDHNLHQEGWDPRSEDYWAELTSRVKRRLPNRFRKAAPNGGGDGGSRVSSDSGGKKAASGGPRMAPVSQSGGGRPLGKNEVRVTPERKAAMQAAGKWDDPVKRNKQLAAYAKYDREHAG